VSPALWVYTSGTVRQVVPDRWQAMGGSGVLSCEAWVVLTQSALNPGDSGGPVVNDAGELVAVVSGAGAGQQNNTCIDVREVRALLASAADSGPTQVAAGGPEQGYYRNGRAVNGNPTSAGNGNAPYPGNGTPTTARGDNRVDQSLRQANLRYQQVPAGYYKVPFTIPGGGVQDVFVDNLTERYLHMEIRRVWSLGLALDGPPSADLAVQLLRNNGTRKMGAWEIHTVQGQTWVVFSIRVAADADGATLRAAIEFVEAEALALRQQRGSTPPPPAPVTRAQY
jgi:hypothetical protein